MSFVIFTIFIPIIATILILTGDSGWSLKNTDEIKKTLIFFGSSLLACAILNAGLYFGATSKKNFREVWNFKIIAVEHQERYSQEETRSREVECGTYTDSNGKTHTEYCTEYYNVTEYYGPYFTAVDEYGGRRNISSKNYYYWAGIWSNETHTGTIVGTCDWGDECVDGRTFEARWEGGFNTMYPFHKINKYENKARVSNGVFSYQKPTEEVLARFPRPADNKNINPIISHGPKITDADQLLFRRMNASLGRKYQIHNIIMLFDSKKDSQRVVTDVLNAWNGPNKNELVTFIGLNGSKIVWCDVKSWMDNTTIHSKIRSQVISMDSFKPSDLANIIGVNVAKHWSRKEFADFDYIKVHIGGGWIAASFIFVGAFCLTIYLILDKHVFAENVRYNSYGNYRNRVSRRMNRFRR